MIFAHSFVGFPITYEMLKKEKFSDEFKKLAYFVGITSAVLPDFDLALGIFIHDLNHRKLISHSLTPYVLLFVFTFIVSIFLDKYKKRLQILNLIFFVGVMSHLFLDFIAGGLALFTPFSADIYGITPAFTLNNFFVSYFTSFYVILEILALVIFLFYLKKEKLEIVRFLPLFFLFIAIVAMVLYM